MLGVGFGLLQMLSRPEAGPAAGLAAQSEATASASGPTTLNAASLGPSVQVSGQTSNDTPAQSALRSIQSNAKVIAPNYTIAAGDTLVEIAAKYNTTVQRIQAFNNLSDPRALHIGNKLVIPPPL